MLLSPMEVDSTLLNEQAGSINKWRYSHITPVSRQGAYVEFLNQNFISDHSNSNSMYLIPSNHLGR